MNADGRWHLTVQSPIGRRLAHLDLQIDGRRVLGSLTDPTSGVVADLVDGVVEGTTLRWKVPMRHLGLTAVFTTTVLGDTMAGSVRTGIFGTFDVEGDRAEQHLTSAT